MNSKLSYLYRDANNYKVWNECVVNGEITIEQQKQIMDSLHEGEFFIPRKVGLPEGRFDKWDERDHIWFEINKDAFDLTEDNPTVDLTVSELVKAFTDNKVKWEEDIISSIEAANVSVDSFKWIITDPDCLQVRRLTDYENQFEFELAQIDTIDLYDNRIYFVARGTINLSEYTNKEIETYLNMYGYSDMNELIKILDSELEAKGQLAEIIFEINSSEYRVDKYDNWSDAVCRIEQYTNEDYSEFKDIIQNDMEGFNYLSEFIYKEDELSEDEEKFTLGLISSDGTTFYISEKYGDLIRGSDLTVENAVNLLGKSDYYIIGDFADNGLFYIYDDAGNIASKDLKSLLAENPIYLSEKMKIKLNDIGQENKSLKEPLNQKIKNISRAKDGMAIKNEKLIDNDFSL